jgi:hypothetical protein
LRGRAHEALADLEARLLDQPEVGRGIRERPRCDGPVEAAGDVVEQRQDARDVAGAAELGSVPATGAQEPVDVGQQRDVVRQGHPVQHGTAHHDVEGSTAGQQRTELLHPPLDEALVGSGQAASLVEERRLRLQPDRQPLGHPPGHGGREVTRPAPEVEDVVTGPQRQRVEEGVVVHPVMSGVGRVERAVPRRQGVPLTRRAGHRVLI